MDNIVKADDIGDHGEFQHHCFPDFVFGQIHGGGSASKKRLSPMAYADTKTGTLLPEKDREDPYQKGFEEGVKDGFRQTIDRLAPALNGMQRVLSEMEKLEREVYVEAEKNIVALAMRAARKIVGSEIKTNSNALRQVIANALHQVDGTRRVTIKMNPVDLTAIEEAGADLPAVTDRFENVCFECDKTVSGGDCIVETDSNIMDARIEKQFQEMEKSIAKA